MKLLNENNIDYKLLDKAINFYEKRGYAYKEVPWVVSPEVLNITRPKSIPEMKESALVASGEQSFLQLIKDGFLHTGKYCCVTPCYRPYDKDSSYYHKEQFIKLELIDFTQNFHFATLPTSIRDILFENMYNLEYMIDDASCFFSKYLIDVFELKTEDEKRECETYGSSDLLVDFLPNEYEKYLRKNTVNHPSPIELGSYGIRSHPKIGNWVYGTGLALPRFSQALLTHKKTIKRTIKKYLF